MVDNGSSPFPQILPIQFTTTAGRLASFRVQISSPRRNQNGFDQDSAASDEVLDANWTSEINRIWAKTTHNTLELARTVLQARRSMSYGAWARLWRSEQLPFGFSKAKMLVRIGERLGDLDGQTFGRLPSGWSILYELSNLRRAVFEELVREGVIHPRLKLREAKALVARLNERTEANTRRASIRERVRRFAEYVQQTVNEWEPGELEFATETLSRLIEQIDSVGSLARVGSAGTLLTNPAF